MDKMFLFFILKHQHTNFVCVEYKKIFRNKIKKHTIIKYFLKH
jgi:hypothetical protein